MNSLVVDTPAPGVRRLLIDRPGARNAIDAEVRAALVEQLTLAARNDDVRSTVIGGTEGVFCAGGDIPSMIGLSADDADKRMREVQDVVRALWQFPKPLVVAVERFAMGAGAGIAAMADHVVSGERASFGFPFMKIGLIPDWGLTVTLQLRMDTAAATATLRDALVLNANEALASGLSNEVVGDAEVMDRAVSKAEKMACLPLAAFARFKTAVRDHVDIERALEAERINQVHCLMGCEFKEGYEAFRNKRAPDFSKSIDVQAH